MAQGVHVRGRIAGGEQGGGVQRGRGGREILGLNRYERPPTDMTGRTHAPV
jgi:hypothetical protein